MKILQKFIINHKFNNSTSRMIFYMVMIFMHAIVSVNTTETGNSRIAETETTTLTKTLFDLSKNPVIAQQSPKTSTQIPTSSSSFSTLYTYHLSSSSSAAGAAGAAAASESEIKAKVSAAVAAATTVELKTLQHAVNDALQTKDIVEIEEEVMVVGASADTGACKSLTGVWGDVDPNIFYICDTQTKKPLQLRCPEGRGFFKGLGYSGCIPYEEWPACISVGDLAQVVVCDSEHMQQPWETMNPNKFFVCLQVTIEPTMLNCESGKGFVHAVAGGGGGTGGGGSSIVGCANWEKWRSYMKCNDYY